MPHTRFLTVTLVLAGLLPPASGQPDSEFSVRVNVIAYLPDGTGQEGIRICREREGRSQPQCDVIRIDKHAAIFLIDKSGDLTNYVARCVSDRSCQLKESKDYLARWSGDHEKEIEILLRKKGGKFVTVKYEVLGKL